MRTPVDYEKLNSLGPWISRFWLEDRWYGGSLDLHSDADTRVKAFVDHFKGRVSTVLELGPLEGAHAFALARHGARVRSLEARDANLLKCEAMKEALGLNGEVTFVKANLEEVRLAEFGRFDLVFCSGILYHLPKPWRLLEQLPEVAPKLLLWTHVAKHPDVYRGGHLGEYYGEFGLSDAQSGMSPQSFWLARDELLAMVDTLYGSVTVIDDGPATNGPAILLVAENDDA